MMSYKRKSLEKSEDLHPSDMIPIVIGVVGHRDIPKKDEVIIERAIEKKLLEVMRECPNSPIYLLTALADGADRLAYRAAEKVRTMGMSTAKRCVWHSGKQLKVGAVLPLPVSEYERDFASSPESLAEFREILKRVDWYSEPSQYVEQCAEDENPGNDVEARNRCYRANGLFIARHSQLIIACWDGISKNTVGGTSDIVRFCREGLEIEVGNATHLTNMPDTRPVHHILTRRGHGPQLKDQGFPPGTSKDLFPEYRWDKTFPLKERQKSEKDRWRDIRHRFEEFNRSMVEVGSKATTQLAQARSYLIGEKNLYGEPVEPIPADLLDGQTLSSLGVYCGAEVLSMRAQKQRSGAILVILALSGLALLTEQLYSGPYHYWQWLSISIGFGILAVTAYWVIRYKRLEPRYLDYRALAEASRVQFFWNLAGINECVSDHYLRGQRDEIEWIRQALLSQRLPLFKAKKMDEDSALKICKLHWIEDQKNYFGGTSDKASVNRNHFSTWSKRSLMMLSLAIAVGVITLMTDFIVSRYFHGFDRSLMFYFIWVYGALFTAAAISRVYLEIKAFSENANRYQQMKLYFEYSAFLLKERETEGLGQCRPLLLEIGKQALAENADWLLFHRQRPVYVPF